MSPKSPEPAVDVGCGTLVPVRSSDLCVVYRYNHHPKHGRSYVEDKPFEANGLVVTTAGAWEFRGVDGSRVVDRALTVTATFGRHYGCRHSSLEPDSNIIVALRPNALDEDVPAPFGDEIVAASAEHAIDRALQQDGADGFESCVFEVLDGFARYSGGLIGRPHGYLRMQRVKRFIERQALEDLTLRDIAQVVHISPFALLRQFKAHVGVTPHEYIMSLRLRTAVQLLKRTRLSVGEIARRIGFVDQRYFARWFSKATGTSPTSYRGR